MDKIDLTLQYSNGLFIAANYYITKSDICALCSLRDLKMNAMDA